METTTLLLILGAVGLLFLAYYAPQLMRLRIRVLRFVHLNWFANWHENHFSGLVTTVRVATLATSLILLGIAAGWIG